MTTKIDVISGFLGAGKTTFIKKLLDEAVKSEKVVLIENEFGEIGVDAGFLKESGIEIREMNSGCICCSLVGDFGKSLKEVVNSYSPERIIIEPSGVGKLSDVMKAIRDVSADMDVVLNSALTVVDAIKCKMYMKNFGEFFDNQIEYAGTILLSRTDIADSKKVDEAVAMLREHNKKAAIITTSLDSLSGKRLLEMLEKPDDMETELMNQVKEHEHEHEHTHEHEHEHEHTHEHHHEHGDSCDCGCHDHHHADEIFTSWGAENVSAMSREELESILTSLADNLDYGEVLRAKGMLPQKDSKKWMYFDLVPEQMEIREGNPDYTGKICVIGGRLNEDKLKEAFHVR